MVSLSRQQAHALGMRAEDIAAQFMRLKGYSVLERRYKTPHGEIDLILQKKRSLVFAEVKAYQCQEQALHAVTFRARRRIEEAARHFIAHHEDVADYDMRFDVLIVPPALCERGDNIMHNLLGAFGVVHLDNAWLAGQ